MENANKYQSASADWGIECGIQAAGQSFYDVRYAE